MAQNFSEYAMLEVFVTTCYGVVPVEGAKVTITYEGLPDGKGAQNETHITDENGKAEPFRMRARQVKVRDRLVDFPKNKGCNVVVSADGYVISSAKNIPIFPNIVVRRSFDLIPQSIKNQA